MAFCPGHIVPGIDFSNDPLLQGRLFSYTDTQISRLGGPNFHELPINRPVAPFHNGQRDAMHRTVIDKGRAAYEPNSIDGGWPKKRHLRRRTVVSSRTTSVLMPIKCVSAVNRSATTSLRRACFPQHEQA